MNYTNLYDHSQREKRALQRQKLENDIIRLQLQIEAYGMKISAIQLKIDELRKQLERIPPE